MSDRQQESEKLQQYKEADPFLYHPQILTYLGEVFDETSFVIDYDDNQKDNRRLTVLIHRVDEEDNDEDLECLAFDVESLDSATERSQMRTLFWIVIKLFRPRSTILDTRVETLLGKMLKLVEILDKELPGEYRLRIDKDFTPMSYGIESLQQDFHKNVVDVLASKGKSRLNEMGFVYADVDPQKIQTWLNTEFRAICLSQTEIQSLTDYLGVALPPIEFYRIKIGTLCSFIKTRVEWMNVEKQRAAAINETELGIYRKIVDSFAENGQIKKMFNSQLILRISKDRPAPVIEKAPLPPVVVKRQTLAEKLTNAQFYHRKPFMFAMENKPLKELPDSAGYEFII